MGRPIHIDWNQVEADFRAGIKPLRQIGKEYAVNNNGTKLSHSAIIKHYKELGVERNLAQAIKEKAAKKVTTLLVTKSTQRHLSLTDSQIIEKNAAQSANIQLSHRHDVGENKQVILKLLHELNFQTDNQDSYERLLALVEEDARVPDGELETRSQTETRAKLRQYFNKSLSTASRIDSVKKLTDALRSIIDTERKLYGIDAGINEESMESGLNQLKMYVKNKKEADNNAAQ